MTDLHTHYYREGICVSCKRTRAEIEGKEPKPAAPQSESGHESEMNDAPDPARERKCADLRDLMLAREVALVRLAWMVR